MNTSRQAFAKPGDSARDGQDESRSGMVTFFTQFQRLIFHDFGLFRREKPPKTGREHG
jgi:hypothetical protein